MTPIEQQLVEIISQYGYIGIFLSLLLGIIGLPIPDEALMTFVGYNVYLGNLSYSLSILSAFLGAVFGSTFNYFIGLKLGSPFIIKYGPKIFISEKKIIRTQQFFNKYGNLFIFFGYFIPGVRHLAAYFAGVSAVSFRKYMVFAYSGALVWCLIFINLGLIVGDNWLKLVEQSTTKSYILIAVCLFVLTGLFLLLKKQKFKKQKKTC